LRGILPSTESLILPSASVEAERLVLPSKVNVAP
jgi:hypothetical protein